MKKLALFAFTLLSAWSMTAKTITGPVDYVSPLVGTQSKHALSTGNTYMLQSSKAYALLQGRDFVTPEDIKFVAPYVLQHRLILTAEAEMEGYSPVKVTQRLIDKVEVPK